MSSRSLQNKYRYEMPPLILYNVRFKHCFVSPIVLEILRCLFRHFQVLHFQLNDTHYMIKGISNGGKVI